MCKHDMTKNSTRLVLAFAIIALVFVQTFGIAPKGSLVHAQSSDAWQFVSETVPDGTCYMPGALFSKSWTLKNVGESIWSLSYTFVFSSGDQMSGPTSQQLTLSSVGKNNDITVSVNLTAPSTYGSYTGYWSVKDQNGNIVKSVNNKPTMWVSIKVAADCSAIVPATQALIPQNGVLLNNTALPALKDGEYRMIDSGHIQFGYGGITYDATPSPDNVYAVPGQAGTIEFYTVQKCAWSPTLWDWTRQVCSDVNMYFRDLGLPPAWTIDATAERQFYSFLNAVVPFGAFGVVEAGALRGVNGWQWKEIGDAGSMNSTSISTALKGMARTGLLIVPAYLIMAGRVFVPVRDFTPTAVAAPVAPLTLTNVRDFANYLKTAIVTGTGEEAILHLDVTIKTQLPSGTVITFTILSLGNTCTMDGGFSLWWPGMNTQDAQFYHSISRQGGPCKVKDIFMIAKELLRQLVEMSKRYPNAREILLAIKDIEELILALAASLI